MLYRCVPEQCTRTHTHIVCIKKHVQCKIHFSFFFPFVRYLSPALLSVILHLFFCSFFPISLFLSLFSSLTYMQIKKDGETSFYLSPFSVYVYCSFASVVVSEHEHILFQTFFFCSIVSIWSCVPFPSTKDIIFSWPLFFFYYYYHFFFSYSFFLMASSFSFSLNTLFSNYIYIYLSISPHPPFSFYTIRRSYSSCSFPFHRCLSLSLPSTSPLFSSLSFLLT